MKQLENWSEKMSTNLDFTMINFHLRISDHLHGSLEGNGNPMSLSSKLNKNIHLVRNSYKILITNGIKEVVT